jgi:hypothetical protein
VPANHDVFDGDEEGVADVELAGDVRRRHDDDEGRAVRVALGPEGAGTVPAVVDAGLDQARIVRLGEAVMGRLRWGRRGGDGLRHGGWSVLVGYEQRQWSLSGNRLGHVD